MFKKVKQKIEEIHADITYIKNTIKEIKRNQTCEYIREGYRVIELTSSRPTKTEQVSFELSRNDWLKLEKSEEWKAFRKLLRKRQSEYSRMRLQGLQD